MKILFMGTPQFAVPTLKMLYESKHDVVGVITMPDKPAGRTLQMQASEVKTVANELGLKVLQPVELHDTEFLNEVKSFNADIAVVVAFRILPPALYELFPKGCVNLHPSLLPELRGAAPINWALIKGYKETGLTTFLIEKSVDAGNILKQVKVLINKDDCAGSLFERFAVDGARLMKETIDGIENGSIRPTPQIGKATKAPKITKELCEIDWKKSSEQLNNLIRGLSPTPCAFTKLDGKVLKIYTARAYKGDSCFVPGTIDRGSGFEMFIHTGKGILEILELQMEGKKRMTCGEFLRGRAVSSGTILGI